jgi:hypothetical protein
MQRAAFRGEHTLRHRYHLRFGRMADVERVLRACAARLGDAALRPRGWLRNTPEEVAPLRRAGPKRLDA